ncbi:MAG: hypothetical protein AMXMBFR33_10990 [Candidatus Xenobia bacterium]
MPSLLTPEEAATRLRLSRRTVIGWLQQGRLPGIKVGNRWRIQESDVLRALEGQDIESREWLDAGPSDPLPLFDWGPSGEPNLKPVHYRPGTGLVISA